jgi:hypothetical protein
VRVAYCNTHPLLLPTSSDSVRRRSSFNGPFSTAECREFLEVLTDDRTAKGGGNDRPAATPLPNPARTALTSWVMSNIRACAAMSTFGRINLQAPPSVNYYLSSMNTINSMDTINKTEDTSLSFALISLACFRIPHSHLDHINHIGNMSMYRGDSSMWPTYIATMTKELSTFNLAVSYI